MDTNYCYYSGLPSPLAYLETGYEETESRGELLPVMKSGDEPDTNQAEARASEFPYSGLKWKATTL